MINQNWLFIGLISLILFVCLFRSSWSQPEQAENTTSDLLTEQPIGIQTSESSEASFIPSGMKQEEQIRNYVYNQIIGNGTGGQLQNQDLTDLAKQMQISVDQVKESIYSMLQKFIQTVGLHSTDTQVERDVKLLFMKNSQVDKFLVHHLAQHHDISAEQMEDVINQMFLSYLQSN